MESSTLWMGDIGPEMDKDFVIEAFANMGYTAIDVKEMFNKNGDRANYCFVDFGDVNVAREIMIKVNNEPIPGCSDRKFRLNRSEYGKGGTGVEVEISLFVGDLSPDVTDDRLLNFFKKKYTSVRAANIVKDAMGNPRGFGFVRFFDEEQHSKALREMNGAKGLGLKAIRVNVASKTSGKNKGASKPGEDQNMDPANMPKWMQQQMQYIQQMHEYMQQCHQYAQQAAAYASWNQQQPAPQEQSTPQEPQTKRKESMEMISDASSFMSMVEKEHANMISQTAEIDEDQELVDPDSPVDVAALNQEFIDRDDRLFFELEASRWDYELSFLNAHEQRVIKTR